MSEFKRQILYLLVFFLQSSYGECEKFRYDYTFNKGVKGWFKLHRIPATFKNAFLRCNAEGGIVASPLNEAMRKAMITIMGDEKLQTCGVYTGIHALYSKGVYSSVDGVPIERIPLDWAPGEPDNFENKEDCLMMLLNGTVADVDCNDTFPFLCFKKKTDDMIVTNCGTIDKEYTFEPRTGSCYKFHRTSRSWNEAYMHCVAEGGHLAIINSPTEALIIKELFDRNPPTSIFGQVKTVSSMGHHNRFEPRVWFTIHGQTLQEAGYQSFSKGQPDNNVVAEGGSFCGGVFNTGLLDDVGCTTFTLPFICEKTPYSLYDEIDLLN